MVFVQPNDPPVVQDEGENVAAANPGGLVTQEVYNQVSSTHCHEIMSTMMYTFSCSRRPPLD